MARKEKMHNGGKKYGKHGMHGPRATGHSGGGHKGGGHKGGKGMYGKQSETIHCH